MITTTPITNIADLLDLTNYAGDFLADYDMDAIRSEYVAAIAAAAGDGIHVYANGDVIADLDRADNARDLDWRELTERIDVAAIFERHDRTASAQLDPATLDLPPGTHATALGGRDVVTGGWLRYIVVWADRPYDRCPRCGQTVARVVEGCPIHLNTGAGAGGALEPMSQQHGCGEGLSVDSRELGGDATADQVLAAAAELAQGLAEEIDAERGTMRDRLAEELRNILAREIEPLDDGETLEDRREELRSGDEMNPGAYHDGQQWSAWDYDPDGSGDPVIVYADDLDRTER
jgi:hypothetical protein